VLRGRCACNAVAYEVSDEFVAALNCYCSNCRAARGSAFLPWGEIERAKLRVTNGAGSLMVIGDADATHAMRCGGAGRFSIELRATARMSALRMDHSSTSRSTRSTPGSGSTTQRACSRRSTRTSVAPRRDGDRTRTLMVAAGAQLTGSAPAAPSHRRRRVRA
jgi:hypothetical protein